MTTPTMDTPVRQPKAESFLDWFRINSRIVTIAAVVVAAAVFGFWFYNRSAVLKAESADRKLLAAKQSLGATVVGFSFLIALSFLPGLERLAQLRVEPLITY